MNSSSSVKHSVYSSDFYRELFEYVDGEVRRKGETSSVSVNRLQAGHPMVLIGGAEHRLAKVAIALHRELPDGKLIVDYLDGDTTNVKIENLSIRQRYVPKVVPVKGLTPSTERLRELFDYSDGKLYWRIRAARNTVIGAEAGTLRVDGYKSVKFDHTSHLLHRVIVWWHGMDIPEGLVVDHWNGDKNDNRIENLKIVSYAFNAQNMVRGDSSTGLQGAYPTPAGRFRSMINHGRELVYVGTFDTAEEANKAYLAAKERMHDGANMGRHRTPINLNTSC